MWIGEEIVYTPEVVIVAKGEPIKGKILSVSADGCTLNVQFADGKTEKVDKSLCERAV